VENRSATHNAPRRLPLTPLPSPASPRYLRPNRTRRKATTDGEREGPLTKKLPFTRVSGSFTMMRKSPRRTTHFFTTGEGVLAVADKVSPSAADGPWRGAARPGGDGDRRFGTTNTQRVRKGGRKKGEALVLGGSTVRGEEGHCLETCVAA